MARTRTTKKLAQRIDLNYFKRPTPQKRAKLWLSILLPLLALLWIGERTLSKDPRVYSSGHMSEPHAVLEKECAACHLQQAGVFSAKATDSACLACHDGPVHHPVSAIGSKQTACTECHTEHRGRINISAVNNQSCAKCHSDLPADVPATRFSASIRTLQDGHPEFAPLRSGARDLNTLRVNHAIHMKPIRRGPNGPLVQLECGDCHRPAAGPAPTAYSDANYVTAKVTYKENQGSLPLPMDMLKQRRPETGRELMAPVKFANACAGCHLLTFDKRFDIGVPHDNPEVIHAFLLKKFQEYIAAHPSETRVMREPSRELTGKPLVPEVRFLTPAQWVQERTADAEELLWRKTCSQCHSLSMRFEGTIPKFPPWLRASGDESHELKPLPEIGPDYTTVRWLPHAKFDHDAHRAFTCVGCHEKALKSTESSDVLIPGIKNCQTCHAPGPGYAESRCFECHTYHDWSKQKEIAPKFTLPALQHGSQ